MPEFANYPLVLWSSTKSDEVNSNKGIELVLLFYI